MSTLKYLLVLVATVGSAFCFANGGQGGSGGGGIKREGYYITFASAGLQLKLDPVDLSLEDIPGLTALVDHFVALPLNIDNRSYLTSAVIPGPKRKYFNISATDLSQRQKDLLISKYREITGILNDQIVIYAVTNPDTGETYILPEFYQLQKESEREAILYHEGLWIIGKRPEILNGNYNLRIDYNFIIDAEIKFQNYIESPNDMLKKMKFFENLGELFNAPSWALALALEVDIKFGNLNGLITKQGYFSIAPLSENVFDSLASDRIFELNLFNLIRKYPKSVFLKLLRDGGFFVVRASMYDGFSWDWRFCYLVPSALLINSSKHQFAFSKSFDSNMPRGKNDFCNIRIVQSQK